MINSIKPLSTAIILIFAFLNLNAQSNRPNIVLIMADDLGFECLGVNGGSSYSTPNLDRMAAQGMRFENCHSQSLCTPSRVQIMTGLYNVRNYTEFGKLDRSQKSFANLFKDAGYKTAIAGKWQLGREKDSPQHFGFDLSCLWQHSLPRTDSAGFDSRFSNPILESNGEVMQLDRGIYGPDVVSDFICDFIKESKDRPFFAYYPMILTHCPFVPTPDSKDWDPDNPGSLSYKGDPRYFADMVAYMDGIVGKIISTIEIAGLEKNTIIIFTGDNGTDQPVVSMFKGKEYPGGKGQTTDNGTHVPLIVRWDSAIEPGAECLDLVDFSDFLPTICEAAEIKLTQDIEYDGFSFLPQLLGEKGNPRKWIYSWYSPRGESLKEFARDTEYKLYTSGAFYNVKDDFFEQTALNPEDFSKEEKQSYKTLNKALNKYKNIRNDPN